MSVTRPVVSVIVPSYNAADFIGRAIDSVLAQTFERWEMLIVDNHSTDDTAEIVASYGDARIALHRVHNGGVIATSRNVGVRAAAGAWLAFLDADDWWTPEKLERCVAVAEAGADLVYHPLRLMKVDGRVASGRVLTSRQVKAPVLLDLVRRGNALWTSSVVARTEVIKSLGGFTEDPKMVGVEDYNLWLRASTMTDRFSYVDEVLGYYLWHGGNMSERDLSGPFQAAVAPILPLLDPDDRRRLEEIVTYRRARHGYAMGDYSGIRGDLLRLALSARPPVRLKAMARLLMSIRADASKSSDVG